MALINDILCDKFDGSLVQLMFSLNRKYDIRYLSHKTFQISKNEELYNWESEIFCLKNLLILYIFSEVLKDIEFYELRLSLKGLIEIFSWKKMHKIAWELC
jgi:hypothetical protein